MCLLSKVIQLNRSSRSILVLNIPKYPHYNSQQPVRRLFGGFGAVGKLSKYSGSSSGYPKYQLSTMYEEPLANRVLSIQSHVVHGYVGNKSATFPLQVSRFILHVWWSFIVNNYFY